MKNNMKKVILVAVSVVLVVAISVTATLAWLKDTTDPVVNTFAPSNIDLKLEETTDSTYKMVPGVAMDKNPTVTVSGDVDAYVFVKIVEAGSVTVSGTEYTLDDFLTYAIASGWTVHTGTVDTNDSTSGNETVVIYREVKVSDTNKSFSVLAEDMVSTNAGVTKQMMNAYTDGSIKLTFTAYAIQMTDGGTDNNGNFTIEEAWTAAQNLAG